MKKIIKILIYTIVAMCAIGIGTYLGLDSAKDIDKTKHYIGTTEMSLGVANSLEHRYVDEGYGEVHFLSVECPSGNVMISYDFTSSRNYDFLESVPYSHTLDIVSNIILSFLLTLIIVAILEILAICFTMWW